MTELRRRARGSFLDNNVLDLILYNGAFYQIKLMRKANLSRKKKLSLSAKPSQVVPNFFDILFFIAMLSYS